MCNTGFTGNGFTCTGMQTQIQWSGMWLHCVVLPYSHLFFIDVDECVTGMDDCHVNATCSNTFGSFECTCVAGYEGNGVNCTSM